VTRGILKNAVRLPVLRIVEPVVLNVAEDVNGPEAALTLIYVTNIGSVRSAPVILVLKLWYGLRHCLRYRGRNCVRQDADIVPVVIRSQLMLFG